MNHDLALLAAVMAPTARLIRRLRVRCAGLLRGTDVEVTEVRVSVDIAASPEQVFALVADPGKRFIADNPFANLEVTSRQRRGVGTVYRWSFGLPRYGPRFGFSEVVTVWEENRRFGYRAIDGWQMRAETVLSPTPAGTRVIFTLRYGLPWPWRLFVRPWAVASGARRALHNLRRLAEHRPGLGD